MVRLLVFAIAFTGLAYGAIVLLAWSLQGRMIYPARQERVAIPAGFAETLLETKDGLELRAAYRPAAEGKKTAVFFHGNGDSLAGSAIATVALAQAGYGLMLVEYRGYGGNPGEPSELGFYDDGRAAMGWLSAKGIAGKDTVIIGNSIGGGTATQMTREYSPAALVLVSPFTSVPDVAWERLGWLPVRALLRDEFDNLSKIGAVEIPLLIQHGTSDAMIPAAHSQALAKAAPIASLQLIEGYGHELAYVPAAQSRQVNWLDRLP